MSKSYRKINLIANLFLVLLLIGSVIIMFTEGYLVYMYLINQISFMSLTIVHCFIVIVLYFGMKNFYRPIIDKRVNYVSLMLAALMGPIGAAVAIVGISLFLILKLFSSNIGKDLLKYLIPQEDESDSDEIYQRLIYGLDNYDAERLPIIFNDVLIYGSDRQKQIVIERMLRFFRVEFSPVLHMALNDKSSSIRVLAATAVARIDKQYSEKSMRLTKKVELKPNDYAAQIEIAKHFEEYSKLSFIDEQRRLKYTLIAVEHFESAIKLNSNDIGGRVSLAELYYSLERYEEMIACLDPVINSGESLPEHAVKWYLSAMFQLEQYGNIRELIRTKQLVLTEKSFEFDQLLYLMLIWKKGFDRETVNLRVV